MTNWRQLLRENDPGTDRMDAETAARMRERVVRAAGGPAQSTRVWPMRFALAAFACLVLTIALIAAQRPIDPVLTRPEVAGTERRQIQFATPGGTQIIWEINPDFTMGDTIP